MSDRSGPCALTWDEAARLRAAWKEGGESVVFTNGCFDILHAGHVRVLQAARAQGERLIVGLNSDASVRLLKGAERPINTAEDRATLLCAMRYVDGVVVFEEETPLKLIETLAPDVLVKGGDYDETTIVGADFVRRRGGRVVVVPLVEGKATTRLVEKIRGA